MKLKLRAWAGPREILRPHDMLLRMKVKKGDTLLVAETLEGYLQMHYDPELGRQVTQGREFMSKYRATFRGLAKQERRRSLFS
jgi:hypothetical protein